MKITKSLLKKLNPHFDSKEMEALLAYDAFIERYYTQIGAELRKGMAKHKTLGPIIKSIPVEQHLEQEKASRMIQQKAIQLNQWDDYSKELLTQGVHYAKMGLSFSDWSEVVKSYRDYAKPYILKDYQNQFDMVLLVLEGLNRLLDYAMNAIAESYFIEKNQIIEQEQKKKRLVLEQLKESESRFRALFENSPDHIYVVDEHGKINYINHTSPGLTKEDVIGKNVFDFQTPETRKSYEEAVKRVFEKGMASQFDHLALIGKNQRYYSSSVAPIFNGSEVNSVAVISREVTDRVNAAKKIKELNESLELRVIQRTSELAEINKELESFSYTVSHDLRQPIRAIDGYTKVLLKNLAGKLSQQEEHYLNSIIENSSRMGQLIDDLLAFSRMGRAQTSYSFFDMTHLTNQTFEELTQINQNNKIKFDLQPLPEAWGDRKMIKVVLSNLLSNALKFSSNNPSPCIKVSGTVDEKNCTYMLEDNGVGFEPEYGHKIFGIFERLHTDDEFEGTGVGLAIAKRIITRHKGSIWAESEPGSGAKFYFSLPKKQNNGKE